MRKHTTLGSRTVSYLEVGQRSRPGPGRSRGTLLLIHAFPLSAEMWVPQLQDPPPGWHLLAPDLRGFGESSLGTRASGQAQPEGSGGSMDDYAAEIIDLLDHLHVEDAVISGLSMGGYVAFAIVRHASRYVRGLILADTRSTADTAEGREARKRMLELIDREGVNGVADQMLPKLLAEATRRDRPDIVHQVRRLIMANTPEAVRTAIISLMTRPDSTPQLASIRCPTLIIVGDEDGLTPVKESEEMHRQIAGSTLTRIPRAGHLSNLEQPAAFNAAVGSFLERAV